MKAKAGEWFSLKWDIIDFYCEESFLQFDTAPKFLFAEEDSCQIEADVIQQFDRIRLVSIFRTTVFLTGEDGTKRPTHYREDEFMPGDMPRYDNWLLDYHQVHFSIAEHIRDKEQLQQKKIFLEHTAKVIRHDMHSGINTYLPRAIKSLKKRLPKEIIKKHKLETSLKLLEEGLDFTRKVYQGVYAFTNLVKEDPILEKEDIHLREVLEEFIKNKAYSSRVEIGELREVSAQPVLFCTALENLIKGGLTFNNSEKPLVKIYMESEWVLCIEDNGVGLSREDFYKFCKPYYKDINAKGLQGLELNIAVAILQDHGFWVEPEKIETGTIFRIDMDVTKQRDIILE